MKTRIATLLSVAGVLTAGSAAALVNTQVLDSSKHRSSSSAVIVPVADGPLPTAVPMTTVPTTDASGGAAGGPSAPYAAAVPDSNDGRPAPTTAPVSPQSAFQVGDAGVVTVDTTGNVLSLVSAIPTPGWQVTTARSIDPLDIEVVFESSTVRIQFTANLLYGNVGTSVQASRIGTPAAGGSSGPAPAGSNGSPRGDDGYEGGGQDD
jgi:hypothetical protein